MFSKHPKGLIAAALANMGERFGFYIMMAILTLVTRSYMIILKHVSNTLLQRISLMNLLSISV